MKTLVGSTGGSVQRIESAEEVWHMVWQVVCKGGWQVTGILGKQATNKQASKLKLEDRSSLKRPGGEK